MNGVILFADNRIFSEGKENELLNLFLNDTDFSVLPINSLECLESTIKSASTFRACIIDWDFENNDLEDEDLVGVVFPQRTPMNILMENTLYTLIYIYSEKNIPEKEKGLLKKKYGKKVHFRRKKEIVKKEYLSIVRDINKFEKDNLHMNIPKLWSQTINSNTQIIFDELEKADPNWIKEFKESVYLDGGDPTTELIDIFNSVLSESIIQNQSLRFALSNYNTSLEIKSNNNIAKLYQKLFYSKLPKDAPVMTGDIFKLKKDLYGILITPECEIKNNIDNQLEFLIIEKDNFRMFLAKNHSYNRTDNYDTFKEKRKDNLRKIFNNDDLSHQILPVFPFTPNKYNETACINFKSALRVLKKKEFVNKRIGYKLNSPYIHQLRQRFISFYGKYGVPAIPNSLRDFNLK